MKLDGATNLQLLIYYVVIDGRERNKLCVMKGTDKYMLTTVSNMITMVAGELYERQKNSSEVSQ